MQRISQVIAFDDAPFERSHRGDVDLDGGVFAGSRLDGVLRRRVRREGVNAGATMSAMIGHWLIAAIAVGPGGVVDLIIDGATLLAVVVAVKQSFEKARRWKRKPPQTRHPRGRTTSHCSRCGQAPPPGPRRTRRRR